jgi:hypothetical protein
MDAEPPLQLVQDATVDPAVVTTRPDTPVHVDQEFHAAGSGTSISSTRWGLGTFQPALTLRLPAHFTCPPRADKLSTNEHS